MSNSPGLECSAPRWSEIETVILDMDGTLLDLYFDHRVWNCELPERVAVKKALPLSQAHLFVAERLDSARGTLDWYCLDYWSERLDVDVHGLEIELSDLVQPRPGAMAFLASLRRRDVQTVLATNAHPRSMRRKFSLTGIEPYFDRVVSSHEYGACKEQPAFWEQLQREIGFEPLTTLLIDDNFRVLETASTFGVRHLRGIRLPNLRGETMHSDTYECIDQFSELME